MFGPLHRERVQGGQATEGRHDDERAGGETTGKVGQARFEFLGDCEPGDAQRDNDDPGPCRRPMCHQSSAAFVRRADPCRGGQDGHADDHRDDMPEFFRIHK